MNSPHKGQWRGAFMFSLIFVWINGWVNNREAGDLRRYRTHCDVIVMYLSVAKLVPVCKKVNLVSTPTILCSWSPVLPVPFMPSPLLTINNPTEMWLYFPKCPATNPVAWQHENDCPSTNGPFQRLSIIHEETAVHPGASLQYAWTNWT